MSQETQPVINRVLLKYGAMFDTLMTAETFTDMMRQDKDEPVVIHGVFGEKLHTTVGHLLGFISREELDVEKAMEAANAVRQAAGQGMAQGPRIAMPGGRY